MNLSIVANLSGPQESVFSLFTNPFLISRKQLKVFYEYVKFVNF